jgi:hypothetical protein
MNQCRRRYRDVRAIPLVFALIYMDTAIAYDPVDCLNDLAEIDPKIVMGLATKLCSGTWTPEPIKCYLMASKADDGIPRGIAIDLCAGAVDAEKTIDCYVKAGIERKMIRGLATTLCGAKKLEK